MYKNFLPKFYCSCLISAIVVTFFCNNLFAQCTASYTITQPDSCAGNSIQFNGSFVPSITNLVWHWYFEPGSTSALKNPTHTYNPPPGSGNVNYIDTLIVTDTITGCSDTITFTVTVKQSPDGVLSDLTGTIPPFTYCTTISTNYILTVGDPTVPPGSYPNYAITSSQTAFSYNSAIQPSPPTGFSITYTTPFSGYDTIKYVITGSNGCQDSSFYYFFSGTNPQGTIDMPPLPQPVCAPVQVTFNILGTSGNTPGTIYIIQFNDGSPNDTLQHPPPATYTHIFSSVSCGMNDPGHPANSFYVRITAQNPCSPSNSTKEPIYISSAPAPPDFTISSGVTACSNTPVIFTNITPPGSANNSGNCGPFAFYWTITPSGYTLNSGNLGTQACPNNAAWNPAYGSTAINASFTPGVYDITLTICTCAGLNTITKTICVTDPPAASFTVSSTIGCTPFPLLPNNTSTPLAPPSCATPYYTWYISNFTPTACSGTANGNMVFLSGTDLYSINPDLQFTDPGIYTLTLRDSNGCNPPNEYDEIITVTAPPVATINPINDTCSSGANVCINPSAIFDDCGDAITQYSWTFAGALGPTTSTSQVPGQICYPSPAVTTTYTITVSAGNSCSATGTVSSTTFTIYPVPNLSATESDISGQPNDSVVCLNDAATLSVAGTGSLTWSPGLATGSPVIVLPASNTIYTVTITDIHGCTNTATLPITVNTLPQPVLTENDNSGITLNDSTICSGDNASLDAGVWSAYSWSGGLPGLQINTVSAAGSYTVTVTDANGCTSSVSSTITVNTLPSPLITGLTTVCSGAPANLDAGFSLGWIYQWSDASTAQIINPTSSGFYTVTVTDANGCSSTNSIIVIVGTNPTPAITGTNILCDGASTSFDAGIAAGWSYQWSTGALTQTINIIPPYNAAYTVTVTDADGCTGTNSYSLTVNPLPAPTISGVTSICAGDNTTLCGSAGYSNYQWSTLAVTSCINNISTAGTYTVTVTDGNSCSASVSQNVIVNLLPGAVIAGANTICPGGSTVLSVPAGNFYFWSNGVTLDNITVSAGGTFTVTVTSPQGCTSTSAPFNVAVGPASASINVPPSPYCTGNNVVLASNAGISWSWSTGANTQNISVGASGTYTVTVTQGGGCTASTSQALTFYAPPSPVINGPTNICQNLPIILDAGAGYSFYNWSNGFTTQTINPALTGTYTVTVTNVNGCTASVTHSLIVNPAPNPSITGVNSICQGNSTQLDAGIGYTNYNWSTGAFTQSINASVAGNYTVTVTSLNGCTASTSSLLTVNPLPTPTITGVTAICGGANANLDAGTGYAVYQWSTGASTQFITPSLVGTYIVTVTDGNGCKGNTSVYLSVTPNPVPLINGLASVCQGSPAILTASPGYSVYLWTGGFTSQSLSPQTNSAGTYTVIVTDNVGCTGSVSYALAIDPLPATAITGGNGICLGDSIQLNAGAGFTTYQWNTGANSQTIYVSSATTYTVTVTGTNGCSNSANLVLATYSLPSPSISGITSICSGNAANLDAGAGYASYLWSNGNSTQGITPSNAGVYTVTITDGNGCSATTTASVAVQSNPVPIITGNSVVCQNGSTTFDAGAGYVSYAWNTFAITQTLNPSTISSGIFTVTVTDINGCTATASYNLTVNLLPTPAITGNIIICADTVSILDAGTGYLIYNWNTGVSSQTIAAYNTGAYTVTVTDGNGCTGTASASLTVNPLPLASISGTTVVCAGTSATLDATPGFNVYLWSDGSSNLSIFPIATGNYTVTVADANGCTASASSSVIVNNNPAPVITGDNDICQGDITSFDAGAGYQSYAWSNGANSQIINLTASSTYTVTVTDANNCTASTSYDLTVNSLPTPVISGGNVICQGQAASFDAGSGYIAYIWNNGNNTQVISTGNASTYIVTVTDINNCSATASVALTVNPLPNPVINGVNSLCDGNSANLNSGPGFIQYQWSTGFAGQVLNIGITGIYTVTVTDGNGCTASADFTLTVFQNPTPVISGLDTICTGQSAQLSVDSGYAAYVWNTGALTPSIYPSTSGTYNVTVTDANGCTGTSPNHDLIIDVPFALINPLGPLDFCDGGSVTLSANPAMYYYWSNGATTQSIDVSQSGVFTLIVIDNAGCDAVSAPVITSLHEKPFVNFNFDSILVCGKGVRFDFINKSLFEPGSVFEWDFGDGYFDSLPDPVHHYEATGNYIIKLTVTTPYGCMSDTTFSIDIDYPPMPIPLFSMSRDLVPLFDAGVQFYNESQDATSWLWTFSSEVNSVENNPHYYFDEEGTYPVKLTAFNNRGCSSEIIKQVTVAPFWLPNTFTPNGDRVNDLFFTSNYVFDVESFELTIYNRWADITYRTNSFEKPWDGSAKNGGVAPEGVYVYVVKVVAKTGRRYEFTHTVDLVR